MLFEVTMIIDKHKLFLLLNLAVFSFIFCTSGDDTDVLTKKYTFSTFSSKDIQVVVSHGDDIWKLLQPYCFEMDIEECEELSDSISGDFYGLSPYTPSRHTSTLEDYRTTRISVLLYLVKRYKVESYLEIGCEYDQSFGVIKNLVSYAVGVDPEQGGTHRMTSDEYFANHSETFDLIFIDGYHEANQAFRDIHHALERLNDNGLIVVHDCNPRGFSKITSIPRDPTAHRWTGDTWKAVVAMRLRSDIDHLVIDIDHGVAVFRRQMNQHPLSSFWLHHLDVNPISMLSYKNLLEHRHELHRLVSVREFYDWLDDK